MNKLLVAHGVSKIYEASSYPSLDRVSFEVERGEFVGIMGASGSGKTTLLNVLSTIDTPTSGKIAIDGVELSDLTEAAAADFRKDKLGFIFQEYFLLDSLTVLENIAVPLALSGVPHQKIETRIHELAKRFGLVSQLHKYPHELSGGQRQRTAAARALVKNPRIVFADEPTGALDSSSSTKLLQMLVRANQDLKTTILMVTHDAYAASFASRIQILKDGKILHELFRRQRTTRQDFYEVILQEIAKADTGRE